MRTASAAPVSSRSWAWTNTSGDGVLPVEWADKVDVTLPAEHLRIEITIVDENRRRFELKATGERYEQLLNDLG
ncbi:MAG: hypothetical protein U0792_06340 [Gemmataceae bacterium]